MIPVAGIVAGLIAAGALGDKGRTRGDAGGAGILVGIVLVIALALLVRLVFEGHLAALPFVLLTLVAFQPWATCRLIVIPLGWSRLAHVLGHFCLWTWGGDLGGGALVAASLAAARRPDAKTWAFIEAQRNRATELRGAGLLATAIALDARGHCAQARQTLLPLVDADADACGARVRGLILEWLAADAADRQDWASAARWGRHPLHASGAGTLIGYVGERLSGPAWGRSAGPTNLRLWWAWLWSGRWIALRPLLRWASRQPQMPAPRETADARERPAGPDAPHERALVLQAWASRDPMAMSGEDFLALGRAWDQALTDEAVHAWSDRARTLGANPDALGGLRLAISEQLGALLRAADVDAGSFAEDPEAPSLLRDAALDLRSELMTELEEAADALEARVEATCALPAADEWAEWQALVRRYEPAHRRGGAGNRYAAFQAVHNPVCSLAVWLWNERQEYTVAHAMFRWLLAEAIAVDDAKAIKLQTENVACRR